MLLLDPWIIRMKYYLHGCLRTVAKKIGRGYSSYGSGYLSYAKVGQCGCVVAGNGITV